MTQSKKPQSKRVSVRIQADVDSDHSQASRSMVLGMEAMKNERYVVNFDTDKIIPSAINPRRISLDKAGVTPEAIAQYAIRADEDADAWSERADAFVKALPDHQQKVWAELFGMAASIIGDSLLQPIVINNERVIISGERRWTASQLASQVYCRVIVRDMAEKQAMMFRLLENMSRSDLSTAEVVIGLRDYITTYIGECAPENNSISVDLISSLIGVAKTSAAYYRALCRLPEDNPILTALYDGQYASLKAAYDDAGKYVRLAKRGEQAAEAKSAGNTSSSKPSDSKPKKLVTRFKIPTPKSNQSVTRLIGVFTSIDGIDASVSAQLTDLSVKWADADDKEKSDILSKALTLALDALEGDS